MSLAAAAGLALLSQAGAAQAGAVQDAEAPQVRIVAPPRAVDCVPDQSDEIVVCGRRASDRYRFTPPRGPPSSIEQARDDPHAIRPAGCGSVLSDRKCFTGLPVATMRFGKHPPPIEIVDFSKFPEVKPKEGVRSD